MSANTCTTFMVSCVEYEYMHQNVHFTEVKFKSHNIVTEKEILSILIWRLVPLLLYRYYIEDEEEPCTHRFEIEPAIYHVTIMSACCIQ